MKGIIVMIVIGWFAVQNSFAQSLQDSSLIKIKVIKERLTAGEDFCELAKMYSEDKGSKLNCGDIGFFEKGELVRGYEDAMVALKVGELSGVVKTGYGYHIIQLLGISDKKYHTRHILLKFSY
ncbi:MAG TPA: peptidylprolyl isomerase [Cytophagaceae bacterium]|jgi:peptidyl-prolyl cis-trans isomerase SurA|nr:peptidylprolyl isomerase [Cytophagaceae bacterium]